MIELLIVAFIGSSPALILRSVKGRSLGCFPAGGVSLLFAFLAYVIFQIFELNPNFAITAAGLIGAFSLGILAFYKRRENNAYHAKAAALFKKGDIEGTKDLFSQALENNPKDCKAHFKLAILYSLKKEKGPAFFHLERAVAFGCNKSLIINEKNYLKWLKEQPEFSKFSSTVLGFSNSDAGLKNEEPENGLRQEPNVSSTTVLSIMSPSSYFSKEKSQENDFGNLNKQNDEKIYYFLIEGKPIGPLSLKELKNKKLTPTSLVWSYRMKNWEKAADIDVLRDLFAPPQSLIKNKAKFNVIGKELLIATFIAVFAFIVGFTFFFFIDDGFKHYNMQRNWQTYLSQRRSLHDEKVVEQRNHFEFKSRELGWSGRFLERRDTRPLSFHQEAVKASAKTSIINAISFVLIGIIGRYVLMAVKLRNGRINRLSV